jgi:hypothetical protein
MTLPELAIDNSANRPRTSQYKSPQSVLSSPTHPTTGLELSNQAYWDLNEDLFDLSASNGSSDHSTPGLPKHADHPSTYTHAPKPGDPIPSFEELLGHCVRLEARCKSLAKTTMPTGVASKQEVQAASSEIDRICTALHGMFSVLPSSLPDNARSSDLWQDMAGLLLTTALLFKVLRFSVVVHGSALVAERDYDHLLGVKRLEYNVLQVKVVAAKAANLAKGAVHGIAITQDLIAYAEDVEGTLRRC